MISFPFGFDMKQRPRPLSWAYYVHIAASIGGADAEKLNGIIIWYDAGSKRISNWDSLYDSLLNQKQ